MPVSSAIKDPGIVLPPIPGQGSRTLVTGPARGNVGLPAGDRHRQTASCRSRKEWAPFRNSTAVSLMRPRPRKWATRVTDPSRIPWVMDARLRRGHERAPRRRLHRDPSDLADTVVEMPDYRPGFRRHLARPAASSVADAAAALAAARQPLLWCGSGAVFSNAGAAVARLADDVGMAVLTTPGGRGIYPEDGPFAMGQTGLYFTEAGKSWFDDADLVVSGGDAARGLLDQQLAVLAQGCSLRPDRYRPPWRSA